MKKIFVILVLVVSAVLILQSRQESVSMLPNDAIRFRVIANSDSEYDQKVKKLVGAEVQKQISMKLKGVSNSEDARIILKNNVPVFQETVTKTLALHNIDETFQINYGMNPFPEKTYNGVTYEEGLYESLVITLGDGLGKNWWCVLFPPLCLLEAEEGEDTERVEYTFFIQEVFESLFS